MYDIITIGSATRDVLIQTGGFETRRHDDSPTGIEQCLPLGTKLEVKKIVFAAGGGGTNAAVTFTRQGFATACVSAIADDMAGEEIIRALKKEGVETKHFQKHDDGITAYSIILIHANAERTILSYKGEGQHFDVNKIPFEKLKARWFYLDSMGGHYDLLEAAVNHAVKTGAKIAFNPGGKELALGLDKLEPVLKNVDVYLTNREEGAQLTGIGFASWDSILGVLGQIVKGIVVVTNGHEGVKVRTADGTKYSAGVPDSPVVERTGAGDAFGSGFVAEYTRSNDIAKAIQFATANASSVVTQFGAKAGILKKGDWGPWPLVEVIKK
ncbi:MAG: carbohydrate kinase family protein [Patescibacteria group bacterium]